MSEATLSDSAKPEEKECNERNEAEEKNAERNTHDGVSLIKTWRVWAFMVIMVFVITSVFSEDENPNVLKLRNHHLSRPKRDASDDVEEIPNSETGIRNARWGESNPITLISGDLFINYIDSQHLSLDEEMFKVKRELNRSFVISITSVKRIPFQNITTDKDGQKIGTGFSFEIFKALQEFFNFSYVLVEPPDNSFGSNHTTAGGVETWTGMIGMILQKKASIGVASFTETHERKRVVDFGQLLYEDKIGILIKRPHKMDKAGALFEPFTSGVWALIIAAFCIMGPFLYLVARAQSVIFKGTEAYNKLTYKNFSLIDCAWFVLAGLLKQGITVKPTLDSTRIFFATWWIFTMLITAFYTANLTAFLTLPVFGADETLAEMLEQSDIKWLVKNNSALVEEVQSVHDSDFDLLRDTMTEKRGEMVNSEDEALKRVLNDDCIYLQETMSIKNLVAKHYTSTQRCDVIVAEYSFHNKQYAFAYEKGFKYATAFNRYIESLKRSGLLKKWYRQYLMKKDPCSSKAMAILVSAESAGNQPLTYDDCLSVFMSYVSGVIAGLALLILERLYSRHSIMKTNQPKIYVTTGNIDGWTPYIRANKPMKIKTIYTGR